jgi:lipoate-protein ligase A
MIDSVWHVLEQGREAAANNMALDEALLECAPSIGRPVLRFYGWRESAATFGYAQKYADIERWTVLRPLIRRPTGGGLVPHDADWTYSVAVPPGHPWYALRAVESYARIHEWICDAFAALNITTTLAPSSVKDLPGQCFVGREKSDVLWHGRKIAGAAQRRTRNGLLIQGSVQPPPVSLNRENWQQAMRETGTRHWSIEWQVLPAAGHLAELAAELATTKYSQPAYNQKR